MAILLNLVKSKATADFKPMAESNVDAIKIHRKPKELQGGRSLIFVVQAYREEDPRLPSVHDRAQANSTVGRFHS